MTDITFHFTISQSDPVKTDSTVSSSTATAVGTQAESSSGGGGGSIGVDVRGDEETLTSIIFGERGKGVVFRDEQLTETFEDTDLWARG